MPKRFLYLIGPPGVGKSTVLRAALRGLDRNQVFLEKLPCVRFSINNKAVGLELGWDAVKTPGNDRDKFPGTDALAMSIQPVATKFVQGWTLSPIVAEGDRLSNDKFFTAVVGAGWTLDVVYLFARKEVVQGRRGMRGTDQDRTWITGRETKAERLAEKWGAQYFDTSEEPVESLALKIRSRAAIQEMLSASPIPVLQSL